MNDHDPELCDCWECTQARLLAAERAQDSEALELALDNQRSGSWFEGA